MKFKAFRSVSKKLTGGIEVPEGQAVDIPEPLAFELQRAGLGRCLEKPKQVAPPEIKAVPEEETVPVGKSPAAKK